MVTSVCIFFSSAKAGRSTSSGCSPRRACTHADLAFHAGFDVHLCLAVLNSDRIRRADICTCATAGTQFHIYFRSHPRHSCSLSILPVVIRRRTTLEYQTLCRTMMIASLGHSETQAAHAVHRSGSTTACLSIRIASFGQTPAQTRQPLHFSA